MSPSSTQEQGRRKRARVLAFLTVIAAAVALFYSTGAANAATPLPVSFAHDGSTGTAGFDSNGNVALNLGNGTYAQLTVDLNALGLATAPAKAPSFTTDKYAAGSPRWDVLLANGNYLFGFPVQLGGGATADFSGAQWNAIGGNGSSLDSHGAYETYSQALTDAGDILGNVKVTDAFIVEDADQPANTVDTLTNVQYDGASPVAPTPPPAQVTLSHGQSIKVANTRENILFQQSGPAWDKFTIVGPGAINGHVGWVQVTAAGQVTGAYTGLEFGHGYTVYIQPEVTKNGPPAGLQGHIYFIS